MKNVPYYEKRPRRLQAVTESLACADLEVQRRIVYGGSRAFPQANGVETLPLAGLVEELRAKGA